MATQKKYICAFCARAFTRSEHKQRHERSHTNEKPFHCLHCTSSFVRRDLLQRHCRTVHNSQLNPNSLPTNKSLNNPTSSTTSSTILNDSTTITTTSTTNNNTNNKNGAAGPTTLTSSSSSSSVIEENHNIMNESNEPLSPTDNINTNPSTTNIGLDEYTSSIEPRSMSNNNNNHSKKRKRSVSDHGDHHKQTLSPTNHQFSSFSTNSNSSSITTTSTTTTSNKDIINHDLIHLLSITKKLETILNKFDRSNEIHSLNDNFLIGYIHLLESSSNYLVFDKILKDLIFNLNSFSNGNGKSNNSFKNSSSPQSNGMQTSHSHNSQQQQQQQQLNHPSHFKIGIIYSIISMGYVINKNYTKSILFFKKSWNLLIKKLIPSYNNNNNLLDQIEILNNLYLLSFIYLEYNLESFTNLSTSMEEDDTFINNDIILNYLNDISFIIISNLKDLTSANENLIDLNVNLFWNIYILISNYLKSTPPKFYSFFLNKQVKGSETLLTLMSRFSKNFINLEQESDFLKMIIISTLSNELKNYNSGENFLVFNSKNCLHNSVILINKSINIHHVNRNLIQINSSDLKLFELFKKNIIVSSPTKFHELLNNYLFIPQSYFNWDLLNLTLQEINLNFPINHTLRDFLINRHILIDNNIKNYLNYKANPIDINNNLSIISFPIIFFADYLNLGIINLKKLNLIQINSIAVFIYEWYLIMAKVLFIIWNNNESFNTNYILQNLVYLLLDNKSSLNKKLNIDTYSSSNISINNSNTSSNSPSLSPSTGQTNSNSNSNSNSNLQDEFVFNSKWFMMLNNKLNTIFDGWSDFITEAIQANCMAISTNTTINNVGTQMINNLAVLKMNLYKLTNEMVQDEFSKLNKEDHSHSINQISNSSGSSYLGQMENNTYNYNDYNSNIGGYRRSNSITIGVLANSHGHSGIEVQNSPIISGPNAVYTTTNLTPTPSSNNINNINNNINNNNINNNNTTTGINNNNGNNSNGKFSYYNSYATYPPPPPILSSSSLSLNNSNSNSANDIMAPSNATIIGTSTSTSDFLLPPILPKGVKSSESLSGATGSNELGEDARSLKTLIPNVMRK
ncbi:uncharacterized protein RJT21DRAFT_132684 [Scheffersomyces amazonensis]|uniref:uncharacterized protein n=1 Tax=Scheffersomyces amazonensis TaxID=1078765 RepID=UPI00315C999D